MLLLRFLSFPLVLGSLGGVHLLLLLAVRARLLLLGSAPGTALGLLRGASAGSAEGRGRDGHGARQQGGHTEPRQIRFNAFTVHVPLPCACRIAPLFGSGVRTFFV